ncbi:OCR-like antirestriction protein [Streptomyces phage Yosif]|uniref:OCR-like antirestriction protein n=1 Tax=Streptomyces phage Yosif TaxID=2201421 RepID=A0A2Z4QCJ1_9CAUD|nr:hypothetical protein KGG71_gp72 [Streptomyces phage Yosif]AWY07636.1 OCR-like antirestriction protein [Streptomyces phage Yosif]
MSEILDDIKARSSYRLSNDAGCGCPDNLESEGALFLDRVRDAVVESLEYLVGSDDLTLVEAVEYARDHGTDGEIADSAVSVYTHEKWKQFVDLQAYNEDLDEIGGTPDDLDQGAGWALYLIASRLVGQLLQEIEDAEGE